MKSDGERNKLVDIAASLKNNAKEIQSRVNTHSLLIEAIEASNSENVRRLNENDLNFAKTVTRIRKDPRNKIIFVLILVLMGLMVYLLKF